MKCRANGEQIRIKSQNQNSDYCPSLLFNTLLRFGGWADQSVGNWHQRKQIIGEHAPVQRSGKRRFKRSERDGKKGQSKVGMKVELVARSWIGNCESVRR